MYFPSISGAGNLLLAEFLFDTVTFSRDAFWGEILSIPVLRKNTFCISAFGKLQQISMNFKLIALKMSEILSKVFIWKHNFPKVSSWNVTIRKAVLEKSREKNCTNSKSNKRSNMKQQFSYFRILFRSEVCHRWNQ